MELLSVVERLAALDHSAVRYDPERCLYAHDKFVDCEVCLEMCPTDAIQPGKPPSFIPDACAGCLACLPLCPTGAYNTDDAVHNLLNCTAHVESTQIELVCQANPYGGNGVSAEAVGIRVRGCLAGLGRGTYLALAAMGMEKVSLRLDACAECPWEKLQTQIEAQVEEARHLLSAWDKADLVQSVTQLEAGCQRPLWEAQNPPLSRRDLFLMLSRQGQTTLARAIEKAETPAGKQAGRGHRRLANAITYLPHPNHDKSLDGLGFGMVTVNEACTACGSCARACPTGALEFEIDEDSCTYSLRFTPRQCIGCLICLHICADSAVSVDLAPLLKQVFESREPLLLSSGELSHCERCHAFFVARPGIRLCPNCKFRLKNPFGSRLPKVRFDNNSLQTFDRSRDL
jgi:NAD-dependent dihydropyrimidine dehydrogenase PreA subunit